MRARLHVGHHHRSTVTPWQAIEGLNRAFLRSISTIGADVLRATTLINKNEATGQNQKRRPVTITEAEALASQ